MSEKIVLIDGHSIVHRAFYGMPDLTNSLGEHTGAVFGFLNILFRLLDEEKPDYLIVAFDEHAPTFRHKVFSEYKGTRKPMPDELRSQIPLLQEVLDAMKIVRISRPGIEADDILGTIAKKSAKEGLDVTLVSGDRDLLQIADEHILIRIPKSRNGQTTIENYYPEDVKREFGVNPTQFIELKALMGDSSDNIPGVPKIGPKTAQELMEKYGSIDGIYEHLEEITKKSVHDTLAANRDLADMSLFLATIKIDCDLEYDLEAARAEGYFTKEAYELYKRLEFRKFFDRFTEDSTVANKSFTYHRTECNSLNDLRNQINQYPIDSTLGLSFAEEEGEIWGLSFAVQNSSNGESEVKVYYYSSPCIQEKELKVFFEDLQSKFYFSVTNVKRYYPFIDEAYKNRFFDCVIAAYLLNPLKNDYSEISIAQEYLSVIIPERKEILGKASFSEAMLGNTENFAIYISNEAAVNLLVKDLLENSIKEKGEDSLFYDIEMPLSYVLYSMEKAGILVKKEELERFSQRLSLRIDELEKTIHTNAGQVFNIQSPKQLGEILFEKMGIPGGKKTKTGYSTAADVLEKLALEYPFVNDILEYRTLTKLKSTYADGLVNYIAEDYRIHTQFNQTITATGRISSTEPNLQNIPIRTELGKELRKVFVAPEGYHFIDADYSQIELRVLASMSGDEALINAYNMDEDIHRITASKVFHIPLEEVTPEQRRNAKAVNFGIVYGISSFGLSRDLSIGKKEAEGYIKKYFETYPGIKEYIDSLVDSAKEKGESVTLMGRIRPIPELKSSNFMQRSFGERVAMNAPIQGTAADIMKLAMLKVYQELKAKNLKSRMLLQVHDEILIEVLDSELDIVKDIVRSSMEEAVSMPVRLEVELGVGKDWLEAH